MRNTSKPRLRVGFLIDDLRVPAWAYEVIRAICVSGCFRPALVLLAGNPRRTRGFLRRSPDCALSLLEAFYFKLDEIVFRPRPDAFEPISASELLKGVTTKLLTADKDAPFAGRANSDPPTTTLDNPDVLIALTAFPRASDLQVAPKYGVWTFDHVPPDPVVGDPTGIRQVICASPITTCELRIVSGKPHETRIVSRSLLATDPSSVAGNRGRSFWRRTSVLPRKLEECWAAGPDRFLSRLETTRDQQPVGQGTGYRGTTPWQEAGLLLRHAGRLLGHLSHRFFYRNQWAILHAAGKDSSIRPQDCELLVPPRDRMWADPFVVEHRGRHYVFVEEFIYRSRKGHISYFEIDSSGRFLGPVKIIEQPYHLSYPFVFEWEGCYYMVPETIQNETVEVYSCEEFPNRWVFHKRLMSGIRAADATMVFHGRLWWLFANVVAENGGSSWDELCVYHSDHPLSDQWTPHAQNPIVSDVRRARPAGRIYQLGGELYRPAQDCSEGYGYAVRIQRIDALTETEYEETEVDAILPSKDRGIFGVHTVNRAGGLTVMDAKLRRFRRPF